MSLTTVQPSISLRTAGYLALAMAAGHLQMGRAELGPKVNKHGLAAQTALKGWYQGCFGYAIFGLNYLRLASVPVLAPLDKAILAVQAAMHLYTLTGLEQLPPRVLSGVMLGLIGVGVLAK